MTYQFKTNINCSNCVAKVTPALTREEVAAWQVNTNDPKKILTVETSALTAEEIEELVSDAGFRIEPLNQ